MINALDALFAPIYFEGVKCYISDRRIDPTTVPYNWGHYEIRSSEENPNIAVSVEKKVVVRFFGTILSEKPLKMCEFGYIPIPSTGFTVLGDVMLLSDILDEKATETAIFTSSS